MHGFCFVTGKDEKVTEVQVAALSSKESDSSEIKSSSNFTKKGKKKKAKRAVIQEIVDVAAGDESYDSEEMEMESLSRKFRNFTPGPQESKIEEVLCTNFNFNLIGFVKVFCIYLS